MKNKWVLPINPDNYLNISRHNFSFKKIKNMNYRLYKFSFLISAFVLFSIVVKAQIITTIPTFPTQFDTITIIYDASEGNGELINTLPVYAHTGVITSNSSTSADWQHVVGDWGANDPDVIMTPLGNHLHQIVIPVQEFYSIDEGEEVYQLAFVFRNVSGTLVGREVDGSDIYVPLYSEGNSAIILQPAFPDLYANNESIDIMAQSSDTAQLSLFLDENELLSLADTMQISFTINTADYSTGSHWIYLYADFGDEIVIDSTYFGIIQDAAILPLPEGIKEGVNIISASEGEVTFDLVAPGKGNIYLLGDFNNYQFDNDYVLNNDPDGDHHWLTISGLDPSEEYGYQFFSVDDALFFADPYSEKVLDPWNDEYIPEATYPNLKPFPYDQTVGMVSVFQIEQEVYDWTDNDYVRPNQENLIVYELLVRDFLDAHSYQVLIDTLNYLDSLGINAIELMPVNEFDGNISWGYNPNFFLAPDKYYGPKNDYKAFIDECHSRGIAVIMDIALNHSFGLNPQVQLYFDPNAGQWGQPTADNPWFNEIPKHDFNVGYDYNHESPYTKKFVDSVLIHWVTEYHIDGYRMDLSKGFTQNNTLGDVAAWGNFDQSRIDILTSYADHVWNFDPDLYMILEHFADNDEEEVLSDLGFMLWGNINHEYTEAAMGYSSNLNWASYQNRGWSDPNLVSYMESHDEERMMFKNLNYGASNGDYDVTDFGTALKRCELSAVFFFPIPGPKMVWQFGELGYDYSINYCEDGTISDACRTNPKPIEWGYYTQWQRHKLFTVYKELIKLKRSYPVFSTDDFVMNVGGYQKSIQLQSAEMNVTVLGNFATTNAVMSVSFVHGGYWYEYFSGDSLMTGDFAPDDISLTPGEYRLYTDVKLGDGVALVVDEVEDLSTSSIFVYPNPGNGEFNFEFSEVVNDAKVIYIYSLSGKMVDQIDLPAGQSSWKWNSPEDLPKGMYFVKFVSSGYEGSTRILIE